MNATRVICVLIVDDDDVDRDVARRMLARSELRPTVIEAETGDAAIAILRAHPVDCVLLDQRLSDTTGAIWLAKVRAEALFRGPVIMVTGAGSEDLVVEAMQAGASGYVTKSHMDVRRLSETIARSLDRFEEQELHRLAEQELTRRVAEQDRHLRRYDRTLQDILDHSSNLIAYWDASERVRFGNRVHQDWFGVQPRDLPGMDVQGLLGPDIYALHRPYIMNALAGQEQRFEHALKAAPGHEDPIIVQVDFRPDLSDSGEVAGFYVTMSDMTALVAARNQAQESSRLKSAFLANMSHEIRTPMNAIIGLTGVALEKDSLEEIKAHLARVHEAALALMGILDDILDHSRLEAGQLRIETVTVRLDDLLERTLDLFAGKVMQKQLRFSVTVDESVPDAIHADPLRLAQVLNNLIGNAVKFTSQGGIGLRVLTREDERGQMIRFEVVDSGIGIDVRQQNELFGAFVQADASITRRFGGTGLGLSICRSLVEMMGGEMGVLSELGSGSTFWFELPLAHEGGMLEGAVSRTPEQVAETIAWLPGGVVPGMYLRHPALGTAAWTVVGTQMQAEEAIAAMASQCKHPVNILIDAASMSQQEVLRAVQTVWERAISDAGHRPRMIVQVHAGERERLSRALHGLSDDEMFVLSEPLLPGALLRTLKMDRAENNSPHLHISSVVSSTDCRRGLEGRRILLAEDNVLNQLVALSMLESAGIEVTLASNGREAVDLVAQQGEGAFDAILLDVHMPVMDGLEAANHLRSHMKCQLPIIAMTAAVMHEDRLSCLNAGMIDLIPKPIMVDQLYDVLHKWIEPAVH